MGWGRNLDWGVMGKQQGVPRGTQGRDMGRGMRFNPHRARLQQLLVPWGGCRVPSGTPPAPHMPQSSDAAWEQLQRRRVQLKIEAGGRKAPGW